MQKGMRKNKRFGNKKGISPVIATVLLIVIAIALFIAIFFWVKSMQKDVILKFGSGVEQSCIRISFDASVQGQNTLQVENKGDITIGAINVYKKSGGSLTPVSGITNPIMPGEASQVSVTCTSGDQFKVVPVLIGLSKKTGSEAQFVCEDRARMISCA
jgi:archaeal type IV pilus assembly protein PilA